MGAAASLLFPPPPPPTLGSMLFSPGGTALMVGMAILASISGRAGVIDEELLRQNPAMRRAEERIRQLEAQLERERQERRDTGMLAGIRGMQRIAEARRRFGFVDGLTHCAVVGVAGSGKSSLINALRGLSNNDPRAAPVGTSETTRSRVQRYEDPNLRMNPLVWYEWCDVPGASTPNQPDARYFLDQGLFIFDCIVVLFDARLTTSDIAILRYCRELNIPACIVRSKAHQHTRNIMADMGDAGSEGDRWEQARLRFIRDTERMVKETLNTAGVENRRVYIVDKENMLRLVRNQHRGVQLIHEQDLLVDMLTELRRGRSSNSSGSQAPRRTRAITGEA